MRDIVWVVIPVLVLGPIVVYGSYLLFRPSPNPSVETAVAVDESNKRPPADLIPGGKDEQTETKRPPITTKPPDPHTELKSKAEVEPKPKPKAERKPKPEAEPKSKAEPKLSNPAVGWF